MAGGGGGALVISGSTKNAGVGRARETHRLCSLSTDLGETGSFSGISLGHEGRDQIEDPSLF